VGGIAIILNNRWGPQLVHHRSDSSQLGVDEAVLKLHTGRLQILATYWPFPPPSRPDPPQDTDSDAPLRHGLYHRLSHYLRSQRSTISNITVALPTPHYKLNYLSCSVFNGTLGSVLVRRVSAAGNSRSIYPFLGIAQPVGEQERVVSTLKFPNGVPSEV